MEEQARQQFETIKDIIKENPRTSLVDPKRARPKAFGSKAETWGTLHFRCIAFVNGIWSCATRFIEWDEEETTEIKDEDISLQFDEPGPDHFVDVRMLQTEIYSVLTTIVEGESLGTLKNLSNPDGLEAWGRLITRWDPATAGIRRNSMSRILDPGSSIDKGLMGNIEQWEKDVKEYQSRKDDTGSTPLLPDDVETGVLQEMCKG